MTIAFSDSVPPALPSWPPDQENVPPCPHCDSPMSTVPYFQVNLLGPKQIQEGKAAVELADVIHICPGCGIRVHRRFQAPAQ